MQMNTLQRLSTSADHVFIAILALVSSISLYFTAVSYELEENVSNEKRAYILDRRFIVAFLSIKTFILGACEL